MEKIKFYLEKYKVYFYISFLIVFILFGTILYLNNNKKVIKEESIKEITKKSSKKVDKKIIVDIKGEVKTPGVYELISGERIIDAIKIAGGLTIDANTSYLNLAKKLTDEMVIIIYSKDEVDKYLKDDENKVYIEYECDCIDNINNACINEKDTVNTNGVKSKLDSSDGLVSINTATKEQLMTLTGIGESKAEEIIKYRKENGLFKSLEDIMNVSGIGEAAYSKIKDHIKL